MKYKVLLDGKEIGATDLEKADPPMGVVLGVIQFRDAETGYDFIKNYTQKNDIPLVADFPDDKLIMTRTIPGLSVVNDLGREITGAGNQITGMDAEGFDVSIEGIPRKVYEHEFPHHVIKY